MMGGSGSGMVSAKEIRQAFMDFFRERGHKVIKSAPVIPHGDPTLMFTNAGMNQFKDVFLGTGSRNYSRVVNTQKCIRVSGKHNDLEEVGVDTTHHTFFEMLGNWSFGDYFKKEAIRWGWEFLVDCMKLPGEKLWATVFGGEENLGLEADTEAEELWPLESGIPAERVLRFGSKDNFWEMAETGPCGPCSEIHMDMGPDACTMKGLKNHECMVNGDCGRFVEIWNLVFIQYNRTSGNTLKPLPAKHVDTGMGFERLAAICQKKSSNYDTDLFMPLLEKIGELTVTEYGSSPETDTAMRVIADHSRALAVAIADGAIPGNKDRGYVLRRILRRAQRFGYQVLGRMTPFIYETIPTVAESLGEVFPEITARLDHIQRVVKTEEESFLRTIERGIDRFEALATETKNQKKKRMDGRETYDLYSTYGFPKDLIELMAREHELTLDEQGWFEAEEKHKSASTAVKEADFDPGELEGLPATEFVGYPESGDPNEMSTVTEARLLKIIANECIVLDRTTFYAEAGGQIGDCGSISAAGFLFKVTSTTRMGDVYLHRGQLEEGDLSALPETVTARVDMEHRSKTAANHTCTHLLHWALHKHVSENADQQGSLVHPDYFRFDFTHEKALSREQLETIERKVNEKIAMNIPVSITWKSYKDALSDGATALFGEKYDDRVRVVEIGDTSSELCGGTHTTSTGCIGYFRIVSEKAVSAGIRRITAETRTRAVESSILQRRLLEDGARTLNTSPEDLPVRIEQLQKQVKNLKKGKAESLDIKSEKQRFLDRAEIINNTAVIVEKTDFTDPKTAGDIADAVRNSDISAAGILANISEDKVVFVAFASKDLVKAKKVFAGKLVQTAAGAAGGSGGGRPDFAKGGTKNIDKIDASLSAARKMLESSLR